MIPGTIPIPGSLGPAPNYLGTNLSGISSSFSFTGCDFGTAAADRKIILAYGMNRNGTFTVDSVTIGGVTPTLAVAANSSDSNRLRVAVLMASVPSGTSGTIALNISDTLAWCAIAWYSVYGLVSDTPYDTGSDTSGQVLSASMDADLGGFMIGVAGSKDSTSLTWGGGVTSSTGYAISSSYFGASLGLFQYGASGTSITATMSKDDTEAMAVASWR